MLPFIVAHTAMLWASLALAQDPSAPGDAPQGDAVQLTLMLDDRQTKRFKQPILLIEQDGAAPVPLTDDGSLHTDIPGDHLWITLAEVRKAETLSFGVLDGTERMGTFNVFLPNSESISLTLRSRGGTPALVIDIAAEVPTYVATPQIPVVETPIPQVDVSMAAPNLVNAPLVVVAAPAAFTDEEDPTAYPEDAIVVNVVLDDREAKRLVAPMVVGEQEGQEPSPASDDGSIIGDVPEDGIYFAQLVVQRSQYLGVKVMDGASSLGTMTIFLPTAGKAIVALKTQEGSPALALNTDAAPGSGGSASMSSTGSGQYGSGRRGGCDQFGAILWVTMGFFGLIFAYLRAVVRRTWQEEVRPFLQKVEHYMQRD